MANLTTTMKSTDDRFEVSWGNAEGTRSVAGQNLTLRYEGEDKATLIVDNEDLMLPPTAFAEWVNDLLSGKINLSKPVKSLKIERGKAKDIICVSADEDFQQILYKFAEKSKMIF